MTTIPNPSQIPPVCISCHGKKNWKRLKNIIKEGTIIDLYECVNCGNNMSWSYLHPEEALYFGTART